jgi:hypothetical protein
VATAAELATAIKASDRPLPLVFLSCCDPVTGDDATERLAVGLIERGVSQVVAMLGSVSDRYATELAALFYQGLATVPDAEPTWVLAHARRTLELDRRRVKPSDHTHTSRPEYAAATVFCHGRTQPVVAPGVPKPLRSIRTSAPPGGPVPQWGSTTSSGAAPRCAPRYGHWWTIRASNAVAACCCAASAGSARTASPVGS